MGWSWGRLLKKKPVLIKIHRIFCSYIITPLQTKYALCLFCLIHYKTLNAVAFWACESQSLKLLLRNLLKARYLIRRMTQRHQNTRVLFTVKGVGFDKNRKPKTKSDGSSVFFHGRQKPKTLFWLIRSTTWNQRGNKE